MRDTSNETLSVIIPIYNAKYLSECVTSIINQTYKDLEIILVDDGSTDQSKKLCDDFADIEPRIKVIHKENGGAYSARNAGLEIAKGKYVAFVDSDDVVDPQAYQIMIDVLNKTNSDVVACNYKTEYGSKIKTKNYSNIPYELKIVGQENCVKKISNGFAGFIWNKGIKKDTIGDLRFRPNIPICDDLFFVYELMLKANVAAQIDLPFYHYRYVQTGLSKNSPISKYMENLNGLDLLNKFIDANASYCKVDVRKNFIFWNTKTCEQMLDNYNETAFQQIQKYVKENRDYISDCNFRIFVLANSILRSWDSYKRMGKFLYDLKKIYVGLHNL